MALTDFLPRSMVGKLATLLLFTRAGLLAASIAVLAVLAKRLNGAR